MWGSVKRNPLRTTRLPGTLPTNVGSTTPGLAHENYAEELVIQVYLNYHGRKIPEVLDGNATEIANATLAVITPKGWSSAYTSIRANDNQ